MTTFKNLLRNHPGVAVGVSVPAASCLISAGYELYYQSLHSTPGQAGYSTVEIPRTALIAATPLLLAFAFTAAAFVFITAMLVSVMTSHDELKRDEGRWVAWLAMAVATTTGIAVVEAIERGAPVAIGMPVVCGFAWALRRRIRRLGWAAAFSLPTFRRQGWRLWSAGLIQAAGVFGAFGVTMWLAPHFRRPVFDWWLEPVVDTAFFAWPLAAAWHITRLDRRSAPPQPAARTARWTMAAVLSLVLLAPATLGWFSGHLAQAGVIFDDFVPGLGAPRVTCVRVAWHGGGPSPFPSRALLHLGQADGMGQWFDAHRKAALFEPIASTTMTRVPPGQCARRAP